MSNRWIAQMNGVLTRRTGDCYQIRYPDGTIDTAKTLTELTHKTAMTRSLRANEIETIRIVIPGKPPTSNNAYADAIKKRADGSPYVMRHLTSEARNYKSCVESQCRGILLPERAYYVTVTVYADWLTKSPKAISPVRATDVASCEKLLLDAIFDTIMPSVPKPDKWIWKLALVKVHEPAKENHRAVIVIRPYDGEKSLRNV